jgi:uncharacterized YigZ family protein
MRRITAPARSEFEEKKSRFISIARPVENREAALEEVAAARRDFPDATHVVYAFQLGGKGDLFGMSDDGEPHGTAGRPVLEVLKGSGITDLIVLVVRYFGGTRLGTGGLVKAYTRAAQEVLAKASTVDLVAKTPFRLRVPYHLYEQARLILLQHGASIEKENFTLDVELEGSIPEAALKTTGAGLQDASSGSLRLETGPRKN